MLFPNLTTFLVALALVFTLIHAARTSFPLWPAVFMLCLALLVTVFR